MNKPVPTTGIVKPVRNDPWRDGPDFIPREHQKVACDAVATARRKGLPGFLLGDLTGLGKTLSALMGMDAAGPWSSAIIVCPRGALPQWRRTLARWPSEGRPDVRLTTYGMSRQLVTTAGTEPARRGKGARGRANRALARNGTLRQAYQMVVLDEVHRIRNPRSQQGRIVRRLMASAEFVIMLSATAGQNPYEIGYLSRLLAHAMGMQDAADLTFREVLEAAGMPSPSGREGNWKWKPNAGAEDAMARLLFTGPAAIGMRRAPEDIEGWPAVERQPCPTTLGADEREAYGARLGAYRRERRAIRHAGTNAPDAAVMTMAAQQRFRQAASAIRITGTTDLAEDHMAAGNQVAVSVAFLETARLLAERLKSRGWRTGVISGDQSAAENEATRVAFQAGALDAVVFTVTESISLHASEYPGGERPRSLLIHDMRRSGIETAQIEGRCHRDGQKAIIHYLYAEGTIEAEIARRTVERMTTMATMSGDDVLAMNELTRLMDG